MTEAELKHLANQLSCPSGETGVRTGEQMNVANGNLTRRTIDALLINNNDNVLEIGPGNGAFVDYVLNKAENVTYTGLEISALMLEEANRINTNSVAQGSAQFVLSDGLTIPFPDGQFDKILTVNTVYFWEKPNDYLAEIYRVLKPGGRFCLTFVQKSSMQKLPFTQYGFQLYTPQTALELVSSSPFDVVQTILDSEQITGNIGQVIERDFAIVIATKPRS